MKRIFKIINKNQFILPSIQKCFIKKIIKQCTDKVIMCKPLGNLKLKNKILLLMNKLLNAMSFNIN
jgi:hypothetical protein